MDVSAKKEPLDSTRVTEATWSLNKHALHTVGPLIIVSFWMRNWVSTGALRALEDPPVVQTKNWKHGWVPVDNT